MDCIDGINFTPNLPLFRGAIPAGSQSFKLTLKGLGDGHSDDEAHVGLGNANKLSVRFLTGHAEELDLRLADFSDGTLRNAVSREAFATLVVAADEVDVLKTLVNTHQEVLENEPEAGEENLALLLDAVAQDKAVLTVQSRDSFVRLLNATPNGAIRNSGVVKGAVETFLNVGVITTTGDNTGVHCPVRSLTGSGKDYMMSMLGSLNEPADVKIQARGGCPGWQPDANSLVMRLVRETYQRLSNEALNIRIIHAGLECGLFKKLYPGMGMISIGPAITGPRSPDKQVHIESAGYHWMLLAELLKPTPVK